MIGGSLFYDFARVGATPAPFQSFVLSAGVVTDYVYGAGMYWQGGCGGFPCDGSGSLNEWNVIGELKAATPLGGGNTLNGYIGAGAAIFWPSGHRILFWPLTLRIEPPPHRFLRDSSINLANSIKTIGFAS